MTQNMNMNKAKGLPFGIFDRPPPEMVEHIENHGESLTYERYQSDIREVAEEFIECLPKEPVDLKEAIDILIEHVGFHTDTQELRDSIFSYCIDDDAFDVDKLTEMLLGQATTDVEFFDELYEYKDRDCRIHYHVSPGHGFVSVLDSTHKACARPCSPCFPGAGDLNSLDEMGIECLCFPETWYDEYKMTKPKDITRCCP